MRLNITGKSFEISEYLNGLVTKKASKLEKYFKPDTEVKVTLSIERGIQIAEVTVLFAGSVLRCEERSGDMYNSIDACLKKLERMVRKYKDKFERNLHEKFTYTEEYVYEPEEDLDTDNASVVRKKSFPAKPMSLAEATEQIEMLGHSFFAFVNEESGEVNVLYRRYDGNYGLLEPDYNV